MIGKIENLDSESILTSYNFARNADIVFSEVLTPEQFTKIDNKNLIKIFENENQIFYFNSRFEISENDVVFCNTYLIDLFLKN